MPVQANDKVAEQYEKWVYPLPIMDLGAPELKGRMDRGDPTRMNWAYWPDRPFKEDLDILVAGCGSNSAARYAYLHPKARVLGIDLSATSLAHENYLKDKHKLDNLTLQQARIEEVASMGQDFDFIELAGVLHHLPDPPGGLKALKRVLRPDGVISIMVYGKYSRVGVYMMQEMFRLMNLSQSEADLAVVKQTLAALPKGHPIQAYISRTQDLKYDAGMVDTFLHPQDRAYTVPECLQLIQEADMQFMGWTDNIYYYPDGQIARGTKLYEDVNAMEPAIMAQFMELYNSTLGQHQFYICLPTRPESTYKIQFEGNAFMRYIPLHHPELKVTQDEPSKTVAIQRGAFPAFKLEPPAGAVFKQIDGKRTVEECLKASGLQVPPGEAEAFCRVVFEYLWRLGYIFLKLPQSA